MSLEEKRGRNPRSFEQLNCGRNVTEECSLQDLDFSDHPFTWSNGRQGVDQIQCRLDRAMANDNFISRFSPIRVTHLPCFGSDHSPLRINLEDHAQVSIRKRPHLFRFEECWAKEPRCEDIVRRI